MGMFRTIKAFFTVKNFREFTKLRAKLSIMHLLDKILLPLAKLRELIRYRKFERTHPEHYDQYLFAKEREWQADVSTAIDNFLGMMSILKLCMIPYAEGGQAVRFTFDTDDHRPDDPQTPEEFFEMARNGALEALGRLENLGCAKLSDEAQTEITETRKIIQEVKINQYSDLLELEKFVNEVDESCKKIEEAGYALLRPC